MSVSQIGTLMRLANRECFSERSGWLLFVGGWNANVNLDCNKFAFSNPLPISALIEHLSHFPYGYAYNWNRAF
jgi:hypothetical protein